MQHTGQLTARKGPRLCGNSVEHDRMRKEVRPQALQKDFVLKRAAANGFLRKMFFANSRNWSFHTASAGEPESRVGRPQR